ncbi:FadR/GntR family transcriptional regulator [Paenibacillus sp. BSR1-1]|uniref:FadR/GntR family transcriptional regulator n=1 Tax=Paenibacillus sp. BSR1-1 TaxID=3020845 RepID=UPI0025B1592A|nr:FadR/GntR family transcriptional regulator [Paenibacillus sp. BSR1-1]MDN3014676.1 FadR/GntR family transcriptional regulator [Paenibacillus sp. BSR1-1]
MALKRKSLVDDVVNVFLKDVENGVYTYGDKLPSQKELATRYQVSLIVIREALTKLSAVGMISFHQGKGTYLNKSEGETFALPEFSSLIFHNINNLLEIVEARQIVESETSSLAAKRRTNNNLLEIEKTIEGMKESLNDYENFAKWDVEFHIAVAKASNNQVLQKITTLLIDSYRSEISKFFQVPGVIEKILMEHEIIYFQILNGNSQKASLIMRNHLELPEKVFSAKIDESGTN